MGVRGAVLAVAVVLAALLAWLALPGTPRGIGTVAADAGASVVADSAPTESPARVSTPESRTRVIAPTSKGDEASGPVHASPTPEKPHGSLVVHVLAPDTPATRTRVALGRLEPDSDFLFGAELAEDRTEYTVAGVARFPELAPGRKGLVVGGMRCLVDVVAGEEREVVLRTGRAGVHGSVHAHDGEPAYGTRVVVRQFEEGQPPAWFVGRVDASGHYAIEFLAPHRASRAAAVDLALGESPSFTLARNEIRRIDFGSSSPRVAWTGTLRLPSGVPVEMHHALYFRCGDALLRGYCDVDGRFRQQVPVGHNEVLLGTPTGRVLATLEITDDLEHDLVVPGGVLRGSVRYLGTKHARAEGPASEVVVTLCGEDGGVLANTPMRGAAGYVFTGLPPGRYRLRTSPWPPVGAPDGSVPAELPPGVVEVVLDLDVTDP